MSDQKRSAGQFLGASTYGQAQRPMQLERQLTPEEIAEWRKKEEEQRKAYEEQQRQDHRRQLRDIFATAALTGLLAEGLDELWQKRDTYAEEAYLYADAMMKARGE